MQEQAGVVEDSVRKWRGMTAEEKKRNIDNAPRKSKRIRMEPSAKPTL